LRHYYPEEKMSVNGVKELEAMKAALTALEPLGDEERARALGWLAQALGVASGVIGVSASSLASGMKHTNEIGGDSSDISRMTPKQFMALKKPVTDVERIACLAYYLTHARDAMHFKTGDLTALNTEAAGLRFSNASQAANNAMNQNGYLAQAGKGNRQITPRGEAVVEAMPDREAVNAALADHPKRGRRAGRKARKASTTAEP
jgi:hypothetical protein